MPYPQHLACIGGVVGVEHTAQVHDGFAFDDGVGEPLRVEGVVVEFGQGLGLPQPQRAHIVGAVAGDGHVVGGGAYHHVVEGDDAFLMFATHHEGVAVFPPGVGLLRLEPIVENLFEEAVAVENAIASDRIVLGDGRVQETCGQAAQATIAQSGVILGVKHVGQLMPIVAYRLLGLLYQPKIGEVIEQCSAHQKLGREIMLLPGSVIGLGSCLPLVGQLFHDCVGKPIPEFPIGSRCGAHAGHRAHMAADGIFELRKMMRIAHEKNCSCITESGNVCTIA